MISLILPVYRPPAINMYKLNALEEALENFERGYSVTDDLTITQEVKHKRQKFKL